MDLSEITSDVFTRLDENESDPAYWTEDDVHEAVNESYEEITDISEWKESSLDLDLFSNKTYYDLRYAIGDPAKFLRISAAFNNQTNRWLDPTKVSLLDVHSYRRWEQVSVTEPSAWFMRGHWWLGLFPRKSDDSGTITLYTKEMPDLLVEDTDEPGFYPDVHDALVDGAVYELLCQDHEYKKADKYLKYFMDKATVLADRVATRSSHDRRLNLGGSS